ncbi:hypothetical protein PLICRDRAFT_462553 [Plicaturopsis crispa FD-325 SS-3]|nr:hypothetical protein PLICRDRAFT_462553 [Plicaturopsis crispa FD-325 SS-3]
MTQRRHGTAPGGLVRTHSRNSSGGSSRIGLNLHFTQKDGAPLKHTEKLKKSGLGHDVHSRTTSPYPRVPSAPRIHSREHIQTIAPMSKRSHLKHNGTTTGAKQKGGFSLHSPGSDEEDDEWVSSESGAATPNKGQDSDAEEAEDDSDSSGAGTAAQIVMNGKGLQEQERTPISEVPPESARPTLPQLQTDATVVSETPRAESSVRPRVLERETTIRRSPEPRPATPPPPPAPAFVKTAPASPVKETEVLPRAAIVESRSERTSPTHRSHRHSKHLSTTRPPSMHSLHGKDGPVLRPHPLIRGQSYGQPSAALAPPRPSAVVSADQAHAEFPSSSPPTAPSSPTSVYSAAQISPTHPRFQASNNNNNPLRRTSISSARSVSTLPLPNTQNSVSVKSTHDRHRTLSTISSTSNSFAALSSLAQLPTAAAQHQGQGYTSFFPSIESQSHLEAIHPLLPPPYLATHLTVLAYRSPARESFDRVIRAKKMRR